MSNFRKKRNARPSVMYRPMAIAALVASGVLQPLLLPVLAAGVSAGTTISNTATANYKDDNNNSFDATSNTVKITVAPVSGLTVKPTGITDVDGGAVEQGDSLEYGFDVKNVGNTPADIYIPGVSSVKVTNLTPTNVLVDIGAGFVNLTTFPGGIITGVAPDAVIKVKVVGTVPTSGITAGDKITVILGDTGPNDNGSTTQNVVDGTDGSNAQEVRTVFTLGTPTSPADNKEASGSQFVPFATSVTPQAFALLKKTVASVAPNTPSGSDDVITYNLNLSVLNTSPNGSLTPAALEGTNIKLDGVATSKKILVSDAVPVGTVLDAIPAAPTGWALVYSTDAVETTIPTAATGGLTNAGWISHSITPLTAGTLATVKRIGFVYTGTVTATSTLTSLLPGYTPPTAFAFNVKTTGLPVNGGTVNNIAQVFGQTVGDTSATPKVVYDESGDANPNNFDDFGNPGPNFDPAKDTGKADPTNQGVDSKGDNTGSGDKGEDIQTVITGIVASTTDSIFNGPNGVPNAIGPTDVNDDFTNKSTAVPAGTDPTTLLTSIPLTSFTNTVSNPSTVTLSNVTVQPISPSQAETADGIATTGQYGTDTSIPVGTVVTVTDLTAGSTKTATYTYGATGFTLTSGTPVNFGGLAPNATASYRVDVKLPDSLVTPLAAVAIPLVAFPDDNLVASIGYTGELTNNITLDRVYTGYVKLLKEARILAADKITIIQDWTDAAAATTPGTLNSKITPGQYIEYRITYQNISTPAPSAGSGNVILNANSFTLTEDGAAAVGGNTNSWATTTLHQRATTATFGTVNYFTGTSLIGSSDPADGSDVSKYQNVLSSPLAPAAQGTFQFRRLVK